MWTSLLSPCDNSSPSSRSKHSATLLGGHVYLLGGRNGNLPLKDMWRYSLAESRWEKLQPSGDTPPCLQEHTAVAYRESIYVFGGELGFSAGAETPLWIYKVKGNSWRKVRVQKGVAVPKGRRGHTAMVHRGTMLVYGGYQDLRGSSNELWAFHFDTESWHLLSSSKTGRSSELPPARHKHSAVLHDDTVWIYGGMTDLHERADLWKWDTVSKAWTNIKAKPCPGPLHSHAACKLPSSMLIFGGERDGNATNELWRFHFGTSTWERLTIPGLRPQPCAEGVALAVSELQLQDTPKDSPDKDVVLKMESTTTTTTTSATVAVQRTVLRPRNGGSVDRATGNPRHSSYHPNNRISPCEKKYVFRPTTVNYVDGSVTGRGEDSNARRTQQMNGVAQTPGANTSFLKEITKLSQMNLSRLSHHNCSYSVLSSSKEDSTSTESLLLANGQKGAKREDKEEGKKLVKSQSANVISRRRQLSAASPDAPNPVSILRNHNGYRNNSILRTPTERIPREMASVPNFGEISTLPTPVLTPIEITKLVFLESDDDVDDDLFEDVEKCEFIQVHEQPFSILHQQYQPNNKRSESYNSHLVSHGGADDYNTVYQNVDLPKSASVRFRKENSVVEFEDYDDVSTSDYASIEGNMNGIRSASNYCMAKRSPESPYANYPDDNHQSTRINRKLGRKDGPFGFSNPNYLGPDINSILGGQRKTWHVTTPSDIDKFTTRQQSFAKVLNSPPDSVLEDVHGRSISRQFYQEELIELQSLECPPTTCQQQPRPMRCSPQETSPRVVPHFLALSGTHQPMGVEKVGKKSRARSASRVEKQQDGVDVSSFSPEPPVPIYVFVIGGKDQGKVTSYQRPVSVWRLQLASNIF